MECPNSRRVNGKVAVIGAGPAGLVVASYLTCIGVEVVVYDKLPEPGGLLLFGIPSTRIPKDKVREGINELLRLGVKFTLNTKVVCCDSMSEDEGDEFVKNIVNLEDLIRNHDAVVIATGTWRSRGLGVPGEGLNGVYKALEFLYKSRLVELGYLDKSHMPQLGEKVVVIGGGLTAVDAVEEALRLGVKEVYVVYRRGIDEAPAGKGQFERLMAKGVRIFEHTTIAEILGSNQVEAVKLVKVKKLIADDGSVKFEPIPGSERIIEVDSVIIAIGEQPSPPVRDGCCGITLTKRGTIDVDSEYRTTRRGVFACGDVVSGPSNIGLAIRSGLETAKAVERYLTSGKSTWRP